MENILQLPVNSKVTFFNKVYKKNHKVIMHITPFYTPKLVRELKNFGLENPFYREYKIWLNKEKLKYI